MSRACCFPVSPNGCLLILLLAIAVPLSAGAQTPDPINAPMPDDVSPRNTETKTAGFLTPRESLAALKLPEGFQAELFAAEPDVRQPIAATTDARGRLWVCENYTYSEAEVNFNLSQSDRILIFEDRDRDGQADSRKVFWDEGKRLTSIALGFDGVYATCAPYLLFIPDRDHDDRPDGPPEVLLDGWNDGAVRHNIVNGLMWGPDGWLYGRHGIMATSFVGVPGSTESQRTPINCGIWRYHPLHRKFEVVAHGTTNPWGMDFNNDGELFMINTVIGHLWHVVPGARYDRMYGSHFNPYTYRTIGQTADHYHWNKAGGEAWHDTKKTGVTEATDRFGGGHAHCGLMFYGDDQWPAEYRDCLFTCNLHGLRINNDRLVRQGNGYVGKHQPDFVRTSDTWFRGIELVRAPDQGFYLLDWQDTGECHENDGVHRTSGRIFKIRYGAEVTSPTDLTRLALPELLNILSRDRWHLQQGICEIRTRLKRAVAEGEQPDPAVVRRWIDRDDRGFAASLLRQSLASDWGASMIYGESPDQLLDGILSRKQDEATRSAEQERWTREVLQTLANESALGRTAGWDGTRLAELARRIGPLERLNLASCLQRLTPRDRLPVAAALLQYQADRDDNLQPLIIWYAIEPLVVKYPREAIELALQSEIPLVSQLIARRLAEDIQQPHIAAAIVELIRAADHTRRNDLLVGIGQAVRGRRKLVPPPGWQSMLDSLEWTAEQRELLQPIQLVFGDGQTMAQLQGIVADRQADPRQRGLAILTLAENRADQLEKLLDRYFGDRDVRQYVIEAYAYGTDPQIADRILQQFSSLKPAGKVAAIQTLTRRPEWSAKLLDAVKSGAVPREHLTAWHARQIANMDDPELTRTLEQVWGAVRQTPSERQAEMSSLKERVSAAEPTASRLAIGQQVFQKLCANCHVLYGAGGKVGPDLTGGNRKDLGYLLENILDPGSSVADSYRAALIDLVDGRVITGVVLKETPATLEIQTADKIILVDRQDVDRIKKTNQSLMPEGLLNGLSEEQKAALLLYLMNE